LSTDVFGQHSPVRSQSDYGKDIDCLKLDMDRKLISNNLLKEPVTMLDLRALYEAVYQKKFTRSSFQRKLLGLGILDNVGKKQEGQANKASYLYSLSRFVMCE